MLSTRELNRVVRGAVELRTMQVEPHGFADKITVHGKEYMVRHSELQKRMDILEVKRVGLEIQP